MKGANDRDERDRWSSEVTLLRMSDGTGRTSTMRLWQQLYRSAMYDVVCICTAAVLLNQMVLNFYAEVPSGQLLARGGWSNAGQVYPCTPYVVIIPMHSISCIICLSWSLPRHYFAARLLLTDSLVMSV